MVLFINIIMILNSVNMYRINHCIPPVMWDNKIQSSAQFWANKLAQTNLFIHSSNNYGENLALIGNKPIDDKTFSVLSAIQAWYNEINIYNYSNPKFNMNTGHFTQLIWKSSTKIGVGVAQNFKGNIIVVMQFSPSGNYNFPVYFSKNVLAPCTFNYVKPPPSYPL